MKTLEGDAKKITIIEHSLFYQLYFYGAGMAKQSFIWKKNKNINQKSNILVSSLLIEKFNKLFFESYGCFLLALKKSFFCKVKYNYFVLNGLIIFITILISGFTLFRVENKLNYYHVAGKIVIALMGICLFLTSSLYRLAWDNSRINYLIKKMDQAITSL